MVDKRDLDDMLKVLEYDSQRIQGDLEALATEGGFLMDQDYEPSGESSVGTVSLVLSQASGGRPR